MADVERDRKALALRRAAVPIASIRTELGFRSDALVEEAVARALAEAAVHSEPNEARLLELDRLDEMLRGVWLKAKRGDTSSVDRVLKISELRLRWSGTPKEAFILTAAYDKTVAELKLKDIDFAAVTAGRVVAEQIDIARASGDPFRVTKAMYLMPHLMRILAELGATPAARDEIAAAAPGGGGTPKTPPKKNDLQAFRERRGLA